MAAFANFGFPESHSVSFAYLVYATSWIKLHYPAAFCAALLNAQPMGFYSPHTLVQDARRHGVSVRTPDVNASDAQATLEPCEESHNGVAVRLGIESVRTSAPTSPRIAEGRPYSSWRTRPRTGARSPVLEALATAGAFGCFDDATGDGPMTRRRAVVGRRRRAITPGSPRGRRHRRGRAHLAGHVAAEEANADLWATGVSPDGHPTRFVRDASTSSAWWPRRSSPTSTTAAGCSSAASSPTASARPPRGARCSSTSRTRPASST